MKMTPDPLTKWLVAAAATGAALTLLLLFGRWRHEVLQPKVARTTIRVMKWTPVEGPQPGGPGDHHPFMTTMTISDPLQGVRHAGVRRVTGLKVASTPARAWQEDTCNGGFPGANFPIIKRRFVVDPDIGAVVALSRFSVNELPDSHLFRLEKGKIRFVHTLTVCTIPDCGFKVPARK